MGVTVREALEVGGLRRCRVVAGWAGLDRDIQYVTVMEVPDIIRWLKGSDLLLTSLYAVKDRSSALHRLVEDLAANGTAALAVKPQYFAGQVPDEILQAGDRLGFPILEIPQDVSYLDIITPLMETIFQRDRQLRDDLEEEFFKWITELAMDGQDAAAILRAMREWMGNQVTLETVFAPAPEVEPLGIEARRALLEARRSLPMTRRLGGRPTACIVTPIILQRELQGCVTCWETERPFQPADVYVLERVAPLFSLEILKLATELDVERRHQEGFLSDLLLGYRYSPAQIREKEARYGWNLSQPFVVICVAASETTDGARSPEDEATGPVDDAVVRTVQRFTRDHAPSAIVVSRIDAVVVLFPQACADGGPLVQAARSFAERLSRHLHDVLPEWRFTLGVSRPCAGASGIAEGYREANHAARLGRTAWGTQSVIAYAELGVYRFLREAGDWEQMRRFEEETVGRLAAYDRQHRGELLKTLAAYFAHNCNLSETADALFIHTNTLKYRLKRIEEITGRSLADAEGLLQLHLGMKIRALLDAEG
ncbi:MAG: PucR family transcriptional regulator ligand-binding domain-containing protein [Alicyclobacillus macrosporangiidus]|uniref:PucR family transcriptional regulator n=1 Tax=Alicyclobacillus macrosporangiidus TaxID=392015 RepID=UPI0026F23BCC|nr:PucR family transcriptional regulator [Alicyclobacillus macrosporangiidus]MCL6600524.1 PucR family transcriptional regulator ligand-binding domain-containing protein [Alicyclobacillus macrosporangiidus]